MPFRISELMITELPKDGLVSDCRPGFTSCDGGCSNPNTTFPKKMSESNELVESLEILRHVISRVESPDGVQEIHPGKCEEIEALEEKLLGALCKLRSYKASKESAEDI